MHLSSKPAKNWIYRQERVDFVAGDTDFKKCRRVQTSVFTLMFMSGNFKREKRVEEKEAKKKKDPWVPITNNSDKNLYQNAGFLFFFFIFHLQLKHFSDLCVLRCVQFDSTGVYAAPLFGESFGIPICIYSPFYSWSDIAFDPWLWNVH